MQFFAPVCAPRFIPYMDKRQGSFAAVESLLLLCSLGSLRAVLGASLHTTGDALGIQRAANDVVTDTRQVLDTTAADHDHRVLLKVMADTGDIRGNFIAVGQANTGDFSQSRVRLLGRRGTDRGADASLLRGAEVGLLVLQVAGEVDLYVTCSLPFLTSWLKVGIVFLLS